MLVPFRAERLEREEVYKNAESILLPSQLRMTGAAPESAVAPSELTTFEYERSSIDETDVGRISHTQYLRKDHEGTLVRISVDKHFVFEIPF
jgi:hypothetical protein